MTGCRGRKRGNESSDRHTCMNGRPQMGVENVPAGVEA